ncbi:unnamed protein product [Calypogeia fissa]
MKRSQRSRVALHGLCVPIKGKHSQEIQSHDHISIPIIIRMEWSAEAETRLNIDVPELILRRHYSMTITQLHRDSVPI